MKALLTHVCTKYNIQKLFLNIIITKNQAVKKEKRNIFRRILLWLTSRSPLGVEEETRRGLFAIFNLLIIIPLVIFGTQQFRTGNFYYSLFDFLMALVLSGSVLSLRYFKSSHWNFRLISLLLAILLYYWILNGAVDGAAAVWIIAMPPFLLFLLGASEGMAWTGVFLLFSIIFLFNPLSLENFYLYKTAYATRIIATCLLVTFLTYNYESLRVKILYWLDREHQNLQKEKEQLAREMEIRKKTENELVRHRNQLEEIVQERTNELHNKNKELEKVLTETRNLFEELALSQNRLVESERRYRLLAENATDLIWASDMDLNFTYMSPAVESLYGYTVEEALVLPQEKWNTPESLKKVFSTYLEQVTLEKEGGADPNRSVILELQQVKKDGTLFWTELRVSFIRDDKGIATGIIGITRDITERRRTQELLAQTEKMMTVGGLAAGMAHEINNPLSIIINSVQNLRRRTSDTSSKNRETAESLNLTIEDINKYFERRNINQYIKNIDESSLRASEIVKSMLQFSRKSRTNKEEVDINNLIDRAIELYSKDYNLAKKYDFRKIKIERNFAPDMPSVPCIETEIEQVILNLVKNAAQALQEVKKDNYTPRISLETEEKNNTCIIRVSDNGPGIPDEILGHIFDPFYTTRDPGTGTGLGLSVSYFIITSHHGGSISVKSSPGKGAAFIITIPLKK